MSQRSAIVVGAGIVGLAVTRALATRNYHVTVIERNEKAIGASVRNFGMIWPIGQPDGGLYERALLSKDIWKEICNDAGIWCEEKGSLHLAYEKDEMNVLEELQEIYAHRGYRILNKNEVGSISSAAVGEGLLGGLFSQDEMVVDAKRAIDQVAQFLAEKYNVEFIRGRTATAIGHPSVFAGNRVFQADEIFVCSGADFETLYPELFSELSITKCKLQMIRLAEQPGGWRIGPSLCGTLSLLHYSGFKASASLSTLKERLEDEFPEYIKWGIHVMASQNQAGEVTIGDSHEYGNTHDPFDRNFINDLILDYLHKFARFKNNLIQETWNGIYSKMTNGETHVILKPHEGVTIVNGLGGAGMTLSFGLSEQLLQGKLPL